MPTNSEAIWECDSLIGHLQIKALRNIRNLDKREQIALSLVWSIAEQDRGTFLTEVMK